MLFAEAPPRCPTGCPLAESTRRVKAASAVSAVHVPGAGCVSSQPQLTSFPSCGLHFHRPYPLLILRDTS